MKNVLLTLVALCCSAVLWAQSITPVGAPFQNGDPLVFDYSGGTGSPTDWIGIYLVGEVPDGDPPSIVWQYISSPSGQVTFTTALANGEYDIHLFCCDGYQSLAKATFTVEGTPPAVIGITEYVRVNDSISFAYSGGTGSPTDWIGIYRPGEVPGTDLSLAYVYVPSASGEISFDDSLGLVPGDYVANLFCCDGYNVLASTTFTVFEDLAPSISPGGPLEANQPVIFDFTGGTGALTDWVGIYPAGEIPDGDPPSVSYLYVDGINGQVTFDPTALETGVLYDAHLFCCDGYEILASYTSFMVMPVATGEPIEQNPARFSISPSPAHESVNLVFAEPVSGQVILYNIAGQAVRQLNIDKSNRAELLNVSAGNYLVRFTNEKGAFSTRVIVN